VKRAPLALCALALLALLLAGPALAAKDKDEPEKGPWQPGTFSALEFRALGPALMSGRVGDFAVDPRNKAHWYVAVCSGNVWETRNNGTTFEPIFDDQGSYSIGCVTLDPSSPNTVWVGTGENNSQRSVSYGDGVYRSLDGGKTWKNMGLKESMHIGEILVHPANGDIVYVAAMGPLWGPGGDRGLYKTTDGGETWNKVLEIDENTGVVSIEMDPRDPDVLYAASYQRRRHTWTLINGGPGSGVWKTTDGGATWREINKGLPGGDKGRIGLAVAPKRPDTVYAIVEAVGDKGGFYRSTDMGENWQRMNDYVAGSPQYYQEIFVDPADADRVYSVDTYFHVTEDGGKTWSRVPIENKHVDDHAVWIDPDDSDHLLVGCDGGIYETWDRCANWRFLPNLPVTQFYKLAIDDDTPFYNVYGGTQDNNTQGGPTRTNSRQGISNRDWFITVGGDGFEPAVEPGNPDIVYSQSQYGNLSRYERRSGEAIDIQPQPAAGEALRWNWDSALIISPHSPTRLYFGSQRLFRSDDRGDSWTAISEDLSRNVDRNKLEVMGRVWGVDTVAKNMSTSFYGNIVALDESPLEEGVLFVGTDDGLIQVTRDGGEIWQKHEDFGGVPEHAYVHSVTASLFEKGTVYACFDLRKQNDLKPYVRVSRDYGKTWQNITGDLPERGTAYCLRQDDVDRDLLFVGTEFGVFFTVDGGQKWTQLKAGLPVIKVPDMDIQRREHDLVIATFGRGFYVLDDYTPLRGLRPADLEQDAFLLAPARPALRYIPERTLGWGEKASQGASFFTAENPPFGAVFTYYLKDGIQTLTEQRHEKEKELVEAEKPVYYPSWDELRAEEREEKPVVLLTISDADGNVVRRITGPVGKGLHRVVWDLRLPGAGPVSRVDATERSPWEEVADGFLAAPGTYTCTMHQRVRGEETPLGEPVTFTVEDLGLNPLATDPQTRVAFEQEVSQLTNRIEGAARRLRLARERLQHFRVAAAAAPMATEDLMSRIGTAENTVRDLWIALNGDPIVAEHQEPTPPGIRDRLGSVNWSLRSTTMGPTETQRQSLAIAEQQFGAIEPDLQRLVETEVPTIADALDRLGAPPSDLSPQIPEPVEDEEG